MTLAERKNIFVIHAWDNEERYARLNELLCARDPGIADYSVPPWKAIRGSNDKVKDNICHRIQVATAVIVLNSPGLHKKKWSTFEMDQATSLNKKIIILQPREDYYHPIPKILNGNFYRVVPWNTVVLGKAIRGEYQADERVFDLAEKVERTKLIRKIYNGMNSTLDIANGINILFCIKNLVDFITLYIELKKLGYSFDLWEPELKEAAACAAVGAAVSGLATYILTENTRLSVKAASAVGLSTFNMKFNGTLQYAYRISSSGRTITIKKLEQ